MAGVESPSPSSCPWPGCQCHLDGANIGTQQTTRGSRLSLKGALPNWGASPWETGYKSGKSAQGVGTQHPQAGKDPALGVSGASPALLQSSRGRCGSRLGAGGRGGERCPGSRRLSSPLSHSRRLPCTLPACLGAVFHSNANPFKSSPCFSQIAFCKRGRKSRVPSWMDGVERGQGRGAGKGTQQGRRHFLGWGGGARVPQDLPGGDARRLT